MSDTLMYDIYDAMGEYVDACCAEMLDDAYGVYPPSFGYVYIRRQL